MGILSAYTYAECVCAPADAHRGLKRVLDPWHSRYRQLCVGTWVLGTGPWAAPCTQPLSHLSSVRSNIFEGSLNTARFLSSDSSHMFFFPHLPPWLKCIFPLKQESLACPILPLLWAFQFILCTTVLVVLPNCKLDDLSLPYLKPVVFPCCFEENGRHP